MSNLRITLVALSILGVNSHIASHALYSRRLFSQEASFWELAGKKLKMVAAVGQYLELFVNDR